jgi:AcrR family transcriptional regulator
MTRAAKTAPAAVSPVPKRGFPSVTPTFLAEETNRRSDIVRAAGRLFREKGYSATTIRDIADAVNMRSGSPFYHFKSKQDILRTVALDGIGTIHAAVAAVATSNKPPRARFDAMLTAHLNVLLGEEGRDIAATLLHESRHLDAAAQDEVIRLKDAYEGLWQGVLKDLKNQGALADDSPVTRLFLMGAMNWATQWYRPDGARSPRQIARQLAKLLLRDAPA